MEDALDDVDRSLLLFRQRSRDYIILMVLILLAGSTYFYLFQKAKGSKMEAEFDASMAHIRLDSQLHSLRLQKTHEGYMKEAETFHLETLTELDRLDAESMDIFEEHLKDLQEFDQEMKQLGDAIKAMEEKWENSILDFEVEMHQMMNEKFDELKEAIRQKKEKDGIDPKDIPQP